MLSFLLLKQFSQEEGAGGNKCTNMVWENECIPISIVLFTLYRVQDTKDTIPGSKAMYLPQEKYVYLYSYNIFGAILSCYRSIGLRLQYHNIYSLLTFHGKPDYMLINPVCIG